MNDKHTTSDMIGPAIPGSSRGSPPAAISLVKGCVEEVVLTISGCRSSFWCAYFSSAALSIWSTGLRSPPPDWCRTTRLSTGEQTGVEEMIGRRAAVQRRERSAGCWSMVDDDGLVGRVRRRARPTRTERSSAMAAGCLAVRTVVDRVRRRTRNGGMDGCWKAEDEAGWLARYSVQCQPWHARAFSRRTVRTGTGRAAKSPRIADHVKINLD